MTGTVTPGTWTKVAASSRALLEFSKAAKASACSCSLSLSCRSRSAKSPCALMQSTRSKYAVNRACAPTRDKAELNLRMATLPENLNKGKLNDVVTKRAGRHGASIGVDQNDDTLHLASFNRVLVR